MRDSSLESRHVTKDRESLRKYHSLIACQQRIRLFAHSIQEAFPEGGYVRWLWQCLSCVHQSELRDVDSARERLSMPRKNVQGW